MKWWQTAGLVIAVWSGLPIVFFAFVYRNARRREIEAQERFNRSYDEFMAAARRERAEREQREREQWGEGWHQ